MRNSISKRMLSRLAEWSRGGGGVRAVKLALCAVLLAASAGAQSESADWRIDTFAGLPDVRDNGPATEARLDFPSGVATDSAGNLYIADVVNHRIRKVDSAGVISTVAGTGEFGFGGDGSPATEARLDFPYVVALDAAGNLFIADSFNHRIRKVDSSGTISTVAGTGERGFGGDGGPATEALLANPYGVAVDGAGNLYIVDLGNLRIRKVDSSGTISTVAGTGERGFGGDGGPATEALLANPYGVATDSAGNLFIADRNNHRIRKVDSTGTISTIAGTGERGFGGDGGPATDAQLFFPYGVALDAAGNLYFTDSVNNRIRKVDSMGTISTIAGTGERGFGGDGGPAVQAQLASPYGVAVDGAGNLFIADSFNHRIRKVDSSGVISTIAGPGESGDGGPAGGAQLRSPSGVAVDDSDNLYIADTGNHRVRKVDSMGTISTIAGTGERGFGGDGGPAVQAQLASPSGVAVDGAGNLFIADTRNQRIRKVDSSGTISTVAGTGEFGFGGDGGPATEAQLSNPAGMAVDGAGNLYIADLRDHRIRKVDSTGTISTVAGTGEFGFGGDGGPATEAQLFFPSGVALDAAGNLFIADQVNNRIRKVDSSGTITTVAGAGEFGFSGDGGPATEAQLNSPADVTADASGNLYIADGSNRIRKVDSAGVISTVAGTGEQGFGGDGGPATEARLDFPIGVAVDGAGNLYIADWGNHRIRVLTPIPASERAPLLEGIRGLIPLPPR